MDPFLLGPRLERNLTVYKRVNYALFNLLSLEGGFVTGFHMGGCLVSFGVVVTTTAVGATTVGGGVSTAPFVVEGSRAASSALMS